MRKRARFRCGTIEFHSLNHMIRSCWLHAFESKGKAELKIVSEVKWPLGLHMGQEAGVCVYKIGLFDHPIINRHLLPLVYPLALQSFVFISYRPRCY